MAARTLPASLLVALLTSGCIETWKGLDDDGDGISVADGDCWDSVEGPAGSGLKGSDIGPGMPDTPYDGIDADCSGNDDYDLDGDGYVIDADHVGLETLGITDSGTNHIAAGDCWDDPALSADDPNHTGGRNFTNVLGDQVGAADVHPDIADIWYDGPDQDCGGNNDFDQDADGDQSMFYADQTNTFGGDCAEGADAEDPRVNLAGLPLDQINSNMAEVYYDGTDQDCQGVEHSGLEVSGLLLDCDQDADGAPVPDIPDSPAGSFCSTEYAAITRDCNDEDPGAVPDPTKEEIPFNGVDDNCAPSLEGTPDGDGDADHDGFWATDYEDRLTAEIDPGLDLDGVEFTDCWDVEDDPQINFPGVDVYTFDPAGDPDDSSGWTVAFAADSLTAAQVNPSALDRPYDGVDQDCAGDATPEVEFDWDGDGHLSMYQWYDIGSGPQSGEDCIDCSDECASAAADPSADPELTVLCEVLCDNDDYFIVTGSDVVVNPGGFASSDVNPDAPDIYGDGTDQDCQRDIDYDSDGDYYATDPAAAITQGEARDPYYQWSVIGALYRSDVDCNDDDTNINPGMTGANDPWYDGIDSDCAGNNDFDQDYDGYVDDRGATFGTYQDTAKRSAYLIAGTESAPGDDCVDDPAKDGTDYNPAATDDWYDGLDHDCADNDDFDADADEYASEKWARDYTTTLHFDAEVGGTGTYTTDDCDDTLPLVNPAATEIWYDGDDDNCDEADDWDADSDGHADEDYASSYGATTNETGDITGTGTLDTDDCNDTDDDFNPDEGDDWYDGLDHDCDGRDDFDADEDAYASDQHTYGSTYQNAAKTSAYLVSGTGSLPDTDCNDEEDVINPGETDTWYDYIDHDCDELDDFDADQDGYVRTGDEGRRTFQSATGDSAYRLSSTGSLPGDDCVDDPSGGAAYNPGETEIWYDGFDYDCDDDDDFDVDADGYASEDEASSYATTTHAGTAVSGTGSLATTDCDDFDDDSNPGETDTWYDGFDRDCGDNDDFDADGDGQASSRVTYASTYYGDSLVAPSGTGSLSDTDCNDTDADIYVGATDTWYDGVDHDCAGDDDFDADGDGYVPTDRVGYVTYQASGSDSDYLVSGTGSLPGDDCVDSLTAYNPGATDTWYDGNDHDCQDDDDWDADVDGHADETYSGSYTTTKQNGAVVSGTGSLPVDDCNDTDDDISPSDSDSWYDGVDSDCGENDDFDADDDGQASEDEASSYATTYQNYSSTAATWAVSGTGSLATTDCNDTDTDIYVGATDTWYDGVDHDCAGNDDFDADGDGYVPTVYVGDATYQASGSDSAYLVSGTGSLPGDDCVDSLTAYNPGATDTWYDGNDHDCQDDDDWDADVDGHADETYSASYTTTKQNGAVVSGTGSLAVDDCNDTDDDISPSDSDSWYDGVDSDCGENDDFDADDDGQASEDEASSYATTYQNYSSTAATWAVSGTGSLATTDCNDNEDEIYDGATDSWYDGVDSNCADDDDYDADGDGYVRDTDSGELTTHGTGTSAFNTAAPDGDCDDDPSTGTAYNPGQADTWYDGLDSDCQSNDDYDADEDDYVADGNVGSDTYVGTTIVYAASALGGECNDAEDDINPGETDEWYDGVDADCAENDDYDADGDTYVSDSDVGELTYQSFVSTSAAFLVSGSGTLTGGDCMDEE